MERIINWLVGKLSEDFRMGYYYDTAMFGQKNNCRYFVKEIFFYYVSLEIRYRLYGRLMCKLFGHGKHFHDESYGTPEHGCEAGSCDRCGWSYHHIMY